MTEISLSVRQGGEKYNPWLAKKLNKKDIEQPSSVSRYSGVVTS